MVITLVFGSHGRGRLFLVILAFARDLLFIIKISPSNEGSANFEAVMVAFACLISVVFLQNLYFLSFTFITNSTNSIVIHDWLMPLSVLVFMGTVALVTPGVCSEGRSNKRLQEGSIPVPKLFGVAVYERD